MPNRIQIPEAESDEAAMPNAQDLARAESRASLASPLIAGLLLIGIDKAARYLWDRRELKYTAQSGKAIPESLIQSGLEKVRELYRKRARLISEELERTKRTRAFINEWAINLKDEIRAMHATAASVARGGFGNLSPEDLRFVGSLTRYQYDRLQNFANQLLQGAQPFDGSYFRRSEMYINASRKIFSEAQRDLMETSGFRYERNVLSGSEHCEPDPKQPGKSCVEQTELGLVPIGTLLAIGDRRCLTGCQCHLEFMREAA